MNYAKDLTAEYTASYAKYVATNRAIPSLTDGLKPVHRRCINSALDLKLFHDKSFLKVAKLEGQVTGDYHPHGGASMTILAQPFKTRYPLFEGQGNWGSPDEPYSVAASRYIETRLTKFCEDFYLTSADYADRQPNYDGRLQEITRYYPPIPGVLLSNASGIAVGLSTNIPPHRISDVCKSLLSYLDGKSTYLDEIIPETCEESIILTPKEDIKKLYTTGECSIQYKAKTHYENVDGKLALVVDAFPPDYSKKRLETAFIMDAVEAGNLELRNESSTGIRYVFLSKDKEILQAVEDRLVSSTGYRMNIEHNDKIHMYKLNELYDDFLDARKVYIIRKYTDLLKTTVKEYEYLCVLLRVKSDKEYIKSLLDMTSDEAIKDLQKRYSVTKDIAVRIINTSLRSLMKDNIKSIESQIKDYQEKMEEYKKYVEDPMYKIRLDIEELYAKYKREERRAVHIDDVQDFIKIKYRGKTIKAHPSDTFYVATTSNKIDLVHASELSKMDLSDKFVVSSDYAYYVMYDKRGLVAVTRDVMSTGNKFKSDTLSGFIGTNDLTQYTLFKSNSKKPIPLEDWFLRTRVSYIKMVDESNTIEIKAQS